MRVEHRLERLDLLPQRRELVCAGPGRGRQAESEQGESSTSANGYRRASGRGGGTVDRRRPSWRLHAPLASSCCCCRRSDRRLVAVVPDALVRSTALDARLARDRPERRALRAGRQEGGRARQTGSAHELPGSEEGDTRWTDPRLALDARRAAQRPPLALGRPLVLGLDGRWWAANLGRRRGGGGRGRHGGWRLDAESPASSGEDARARDNLDQPCRCRACGEYDRQQHLREGGSPLRADVGEGTQVMADIRDSLAS